MGCDIHGVFQKKTPEGWADVASDYGENRHYALFGWLGNVRNRSGVEPLSDCRGFPEDFAIDDDYHGAKWLGDHSHSWLAADEILGATIPVIAEDEFDYFLDEVHLLKARHGEVRFVFGFDS